MSRPTRSASADLAAAARRRRRDGRGAVAVEFALILPVLLAFMLGVISIGHAFYTLSSTQWAIERSVRSLMLDPALTEAALEAAVAAQLHALTGATVDLTLTTEQEGWMPVTRVSATIAYPLMEPFFAGAVITRTIVAYAPRPM